MSSFLHLLRLLCTSTFVVVVSARPNVLFFFCDDSGREMGAYGHTFVKSPNLDYLADHSMVFNYAYTSVSSCSPSRSATLTGLPVHQNGMFGLAGRFNYHSFDVLAPAETAPALSGLHLPPTLGQLLSLNGYFTGLIGKYHVLPRDLYYFDYLRSESNGYNLDEIGRNLTFMKGFVNEFFDNVTVSKQPWFLEIAFHDTHRGCNNTFCNFWGNCTGDNGCIPDWTPVLYDAAAIPLPYWIPDTPEARQDYANYLTSFSRLDQGVGLFLDILKQRKLLEDTLIIFSSDNGEPFPASKTNLYEEGQIEPFMMLLPEWWNTHSAPVYTDFLASNTDIFPTILEWTNITYPAYNLWGLPVTFTGQSLLPVLMRNHDHHDHNQKQPPQSLDRQSYVYGSHILHEATMYYPMRVLRTTQYRLIHNLNFQAPFHMAQDVGNGATFQKLAADTKNGVDTHWFKNLTAYTFRQEWELFDMIADPQQMSNLAYDSKYQTIFTQLSANLSQWMYVTNDGWQCDANYECNFSNNY